MVRKPKNTRCEQRNDYQNDSQPQARAYDTRIDVSPQKSMSKKKRVW